MAENILFFSVSDAMTVIARKLFSTMHRNILIVSGAKSTALSIAASHPESNTYIARGGTAELLRTVPGKTVVELSTSLEEVLDAVQLLTGKGFKKIGVVVPQGILDGLNKDYRLFDVFVYIRASKGNDLDLLLSNLRHQGVQAVIVNGSTVQTAERMGFTVEILNNGISSIKQAVHRALEIEKNAEYERERQQRNLDQIQGYSTQLSQAVGQAFEAVKELEASSQNLAAVCEKTSEISNTAYTQVNDTKEVLALIKKIASQTSILGINGAIESARAGVEGKGFAVITHEIRQLSNESNYAAEQIDKDLQALQTSMTSMLENARQCNEISQSQADENSKISKMLQSLAESGQQMVDFMDSMHS